MIAIDKFEFDRIVAFPEEWKKGERRRYEIMMKNRETRRKKKDMKNQEILFDMFIKRYTIMNYERTKYRDRSSQEAQQGRETAQEIRIESGYRTNGQRKFPLLL